MSPRVTPEDIALQEARARVAQISERLRAAEHELRDAELNAIARQEPKTQIIRFAKRFEDSTTVYEYAAIRLVDVDRWYITGATAPQGITWRRLVQFIQRDNIIPFAYQEVFAELPF